MSKVRTILGDIPLDTLGHTLVHEHIFWDFDPAAHLKCLDFSTFELQKLVSAGGKTIVDVGPHPYRDPQWYQAIATRVDLQIILSTGFYLEKRRIAPEYLAYSESEMVDRFLKELTVGIGSSEVKAGMIKVAAATAQLTPWETRVFLAAARVQRQTGVPICTHAIFGGLVQFRLLVDAGADPERIYISHTETEIGWEGRSVDQQLEYLVQITRLGGNLYFSNFGWEFLSPQEHLKRLMLTLCDKGFAGQLFLGADANYKIDEQGEIFWEEQKAHPDLPVKNFTYPFTFMFPLLKKWGFTDTDVAGFFVQNPRKLFSTVRL